MINIVQKAIDMLTRQEAKDESFVGVRLKSVFDAVLSERLITIVVETVSKCNLRCVFCDAHSGRAPEFSKHAGLMTDHTWDRFVHTLDDYVAANGPLKMLQFFGNGEPLLDKKLAHRIETVTRKNLCEATRVISNGVIATPDRVRSLVLAGLSEIHFSVDILDRARYLEIKKQDAAHKVLANIQAAMDIIEKHKTTQMFIKYFVEGEETDFGVHDRDGLEVVEQFYDRAERSRYIHLKEQPLVSTGIGHLKGEADQVLPCEVPFYLLYVLHTGKVSACCTDVFSGLTVGDIHQKTIREIGSGPELAKIRLSHLKGQCGEIPLCKGCGNRTSVDLSKLGADETIAMVNAIEKNM